jgi:hypothetical protein
MRYRKNIIAYSIFLLVVSHLALLSGCASTRPFTSVSTGEDIKGALSQKSRYAPLSEAQLQAMVMNFEDLYVMSIWQTYDEIRRSTDNAEIRATAQSLKVRSNSNAITIAAGRNPAVNLLDMLVFVSLGRHAVENYWVPEVFGSPGEPLVKTYRKLETEIWKISARVLSEDQQKTLQNLIQEWIAANPGQHYRKGVLPLKGGKRKGNMRSALCALRPQHSARLLGTLNLHSLAFLAP